VCATPLRKRPTVATAVLTPLPPPPSSADAETIAMPVSDPLNTGGLTSGFSPGQTFGNRYQIISLLGAGGMGAVYHVWDTELALSLALKIIRPESDPFAAQELERRFKRELVLARQVTHTNVIRIHDLGEINGIKYITMPFVHGTDLARLLATEGKLSVERSVALARQIVSGLRAAHEVGIVHRDLKPANILIADDEKAIITDFGIARSTDAASYATAATAAGAIIGTLAYMAPEQASGKPADQRSDIYALGLILYEMLVGKRGASGGDTALALLIERSKHAPPGLRTLDSTIPEPVERLVTKCLEPDPAARFQTSAEVEAALDQMDATGNERFKPQVTPVAAPTTNRRSWMAAAVAILALVGVGVWMLLSGVDPAPPSPQQREPVSVLIADFQNDANEPVFQGSLEQALSIAIEGASFITTYSRATAQAQAAQLRPGARLDLESAQLVAASEGLKVILTGSIALRASGSGYLMTVKAIDAANAKELATAQADVDDKASVLKGVQAVASTLRQALGDTTPESARLAAGETVTTTSLEALKLYSTAQDLSSSGNEEKAIEEYKKAIELDPKFGRAYSGWATALFNIGKRDEAAEQYKNAMNLLDRMTEREKYRTQGAYFLGPAASYDQAIDSFRELVRRYPADRAAHNNLGLAYFNTLDFPKAKEHALEALKIYPQNTRARNNYALYAMYSGDFKTAAEEASKVIEKNSQTFKAYLVMASAAFASSDMKGVREAYARMAKAGAAGVSLSNHGLADIAMYEGRFSEAIDLLKTGIASDEAASNRTARAAKLAVLAEAQLADRQTAQAVDSARKALEAAQSREDATLVPAAFVLLNANLARDARAIADELGQQFQPRSRAYGEMIHAEIARAAGRRPESADALGRARKLADLWLGRYLMGVINVEAGRFENAQPDLELCLKRKGEATALFLNDVPTFRYLAPLQYWLARAQDGRKQATAADSYRAFLALRPGASKDPLAADAQKRLQALGGPSAR
jgi:eukaryotic-like serine/threonine-protein kinase